MESYDNVVQSVSKSVCIGIDRKYSMVDATNEILKLTKIDFMFVMVCGIDVLQALCLHFAYWKAYLMLFYTGLPSSSHKATTSKLVSNMGLKSSFHYQHICLH